MTRGIGLRGERVVHYGGFGDPEHYLDRLVRAIPSESHSIGLVMRPDVASIIRIADIDDETRAGLTSLPVQGMDGGFEDRQRPSIGLASLALWGQHGVHPFESVRFDYSPFSLRHPLRKKARLFYEGPMQPGMPGLQNEVKVPKSRDGKRWFGIFMTGDLVGRKTSEVKDMAGMLMQNGYRTTALVVRQNPQLIGKNTVEEDAILYGRDCQKKEVVISGSSGEGYVGLEDLARSISGTS